MIDEVILRDIRQHLLLSRGEVAATRNTANQSWHDLQEPEIEREETAEKANLSRGVNSIADLAYGRLRQIDAAIEKIDAGGYGDCERCGQPIAMARLKVIPWTPFCRFCAEKIESSGDGEGQPRDLEEGNDSQSDAEMRDIVLDTLARDGRVEMEELDIDCRDGVIRATGVLPSEGSREILWEIVSDILGYTRFVENVRIDRQPWERRKRNPGKARIETPEKEVLMAGETEDVDAYTAIDTGEPIQPPDRLSPERTSGS
ncbi:MAG: TraR/DksA C4-type zinc finger protein [Desulfobacterales bacterium]